MFCVNVTIAFFNQSTCSYALASRFSANSQKIVRGIDDEDEAKVANKKVNGNTFQPFCGSYCIFT